MSWSPQQDKAITAVNRWLADPKAPQVFYLFGYAGTGKTTLAKHLAEGVKGEVLFAAFTGKAASVLRKKGCSGASTIHSLIYKPVQDERTGKVDFVLNPDSPVAYAPCVMIDEVSMVDGELGNDLLSYGTKVLVMGDPFQLPPVKGEGFFNVAQPDVMLTEIHRQAAENPIVRMSMDIRDGRALVPGQYGESLVVRRRDISKEAMAEAVLGADQVLCGMNKTRQTFNQRIRELKGIAGKAAPWHPTSGDRLVCLKNNRLKGLFNGGLWEAGAVQCRVMAYGTRIKMVVKSLDEEHVPAVDVTVADNFFRGTEKEMDWRERRLSDEFTMGYALTAHKSQGSQWPSVFVYDESSVFRESAPNHIYTALTRAAEKVTVVL